MVLNTNKTDHHSITELLLTVALNNNKTDHHSITELLLTVVLNTNKTDHHSITELLLKVTINAITQPKKVTMDNFLRGTVEYWFTRCNFNLILEKTS